MANFPSNVSDNKTLYTVKNGLSAVLVGNIGSTGDSITVDDASLFPQYGALVIESEVVTYSGITTNTFDNCLRGQDGSTAASHLDGVAVEHNWCALHVNRLTDEVIALEDHLIGTTHEEIISLSGVTSNIQDQLDTKAELTQLVTASGYLQSQIDDNLRIGQAIEGATWDPGSQTPGLDHNYMLIQSGSGTLNAAENLNNAMYVEHDQTYGLGIGVHPGSGSGRGISVNGDVNAKDIYANYGFGTAGPGTGGSFIVVGSGTLDKPAFAVWGNTQPYPAGIYFPDNKTSLAIATEGVERLKVNSSSFELDVPLKYSTGASDGYVLTSDSSGVGTWEPASGGGIPTLVEDPTSGSPCVYILGTDLKFFNGTQPYFISLTE